jgi:hypothetical protein
VHSSERKYVKTPVDERYQQVGYNVRDKTYKLISTTVMDSAPFKEGLYELLSKDENNNYATSLKRKNLKLKIMAASPTNLSLILSSHLSNNKYQLNEKLKKELFDRFSETVDSLFYAGVKSRHMLYNL